MTQLNDIESFFRNEFSSHGESAVGVGWNGTPAQEIRFEQLSKVILPDKPFDVIDFGCGYGAMAAWFRSKGLFFSNYHGVDIVEESLNAAQKRYEGDDTIHFHRSINEIQEADYLVASGVFNIKMTHDPKEWTEYVLDSLKSFDQHTSRGFAVNFLTSYSDPERMALRPDLYYADPCFLFDFCRRNLSKNVAILHDYKIWDFTLIVRKEFD